MTTRHFGLRLPFALLMALAAFVLAGCIRVELTFTVEEDGSGTVGMLAAIDEALLAASDESAEEMFGEVDDLPPGAVVEEYREDGFVGQRMSVPVPDMELAAESLGGVDDMTDAADFEFVREGDSWRFTMKMPPLGEETGRRERRLRRRHDGCIRQLRRIPGARLVARRGYGAQRRPSRERRAGVGT